MRIIAFVLAFIVLALSCQPCADGAYATMAGKTKTEILKTPTQQNESGHNDACTPFCHCTCCAGFSINHIIASVNSINFLAGKNFVSYLRASIIEISLPIWQPPQLVS